MKEILGAIKEAELQAQQIIEAAQKKVREIDIKNQQEVERMRLAAETKIKNQINQMNTEAETAAIKNQNEELVIDKEKAEQAKKYIIEAFIKRYAQ